jgi:hypothetical protein
LKEIKLNLTAFKNVQNLGKKILKLCEKANLHKLNFSHFSLAEKFENFAD